MVNLMQIWPFCTYKKKKTNWLRCNFELKKIFLNGGDADSNSVDCCCFFFDNNCFVCLMILVCVYSFLLQPIMSQIATMAVLLFIYLFIYFSRSFILYSWYERKEFDFWNDSIESADYWHVWHFKLPLNCIELSHKNQLHSWKKRK